MLQKTSNWILERCGQIITLLPGDCLVCGRTCQRRHNLCLDCEQALPWITNACDSCGQALHERGGHWLCLYCQNQGVAVSRCVSALHYAEPVAWMLADFKFEGKLANGTLLATLLARRIQTRYSCQELPELILPVPLHPARWRQRGFNQSLEISRQLARHCKLRLGSRVLRRHKATLPQSELDSVAARRSNVRNAFTVADPTQLRNIYHVAIIDDVITTMATVNAVASCLTRFGIGRIDAWSVARVQR